MKIYLKLALIGVILAVLSGCTIGKGNRIDSTNIPKIIKGVTTKQEVVKMFGQPSSTQITGDGTETWNYSYVRGGHAFGLYGMLVGMGNPYDTSSYQHQYLIIDFKGDIVSDYNFSTTGNVN